MPDSSDTTHLLNFIVDRAHVGIFVINQKREILLWNQFMEIHSERKAHTVVGKNLFEAFPELPKKWLDRKIENIFNPQKLLLHLLGTTPVFIQIRPQSPGDRRRGLHAPGLHVDAGQR